MARFDEQRLARHGAPFAEKLLFYLMGVADPAYYLHNLYLRRKLARMQNFKPARILDAGCGAGDHSFYVARRYPRSMVLGVDINEARIIQNRAMARTLGISNVHFELADLSVADFPDRFDLIVSIDVLEHISRQREAIACLARALTGGGIAFFHLPTVRERPVPFSKHLSGFHEWAEDEHIAEERTAGEFVELVRASGLEIMRWHRTFGYMTGELANSLFVLPYERTTFNRALLAFMAIPCRLLALADLLNLEQTRYAVAVWARKPS